MRPGRLAAFAVGYVLGTRAGRARYEAIVAAAQRLGSRLEAYAEHQDGPVRPGARDPQAGTQRG